MLASSQSTGLHRHSLNRRIPLNHDFAEISEQFSEIPSGTALSVTTDNSHTTDAQRDDFFVPLRWGKVPLFGREKEIKIIRECMNSVCEGREKAAALIVYGPSGIGKSAMIRTLAEESAGSESTGATWVSGKYGQEGGSGRPFCAIVDAATELCYVVEESDKDLQIRNRIRSELNIDDLQLLASVVPVVTI